MERTQLEQLLKIWNNTTKEYKLSMVVSVTGVTISSGVTRRIPRVTDVEIETAQMEQGGAL